MIRVGLVGYGMAGRVFHAPMITAVDGLEFAAVVEGSGRTAEAAYPGITTYASLESMLEDASIELIVIATPNTTHAPFAELALRAGRHVVVDKPTAITTAEIAALIETAAAEDRFLIPFHNRRFDNDFQTLQKVLREEMLGRVVYVESTFDRWRPAPRRAVWREDGTPGGGIVLDLGTHVADQALLQFGLPEAVSADISHERDNGVTDDAFAIRLHYPRLTVMLGATALAAQPRPRYTVRGTKGSFVKWGLDPQEARLKATGRVVEPGWGVEPASSWGTLTVDVEGAMVSRPVPSIPGDYRRYYAAVRDALLGKSAPPVLAADALRVAKVLEWARQSSAERREIKCSWDN